MLSPSLPHSSPASRLRSLPWRPILSCGGALISGAIGASLLARSTPNSVSAPDTTLSNWEMAMPITLTTLVRAEAPPGRQIRGTLSADADITGRAPVGGAVARWLVEPGARVRQGQPVVEISSGEASRPAPAAESLQVEAERQQAAAVDGQADLAQDLAQLQGKLFGAQDRVKRAQERVARSREIIQKLARGEYVPAPDTRRVTRQVPRLAPARVVSRSKQVGPTEGELAAASALKASQRESVTAAQALRDAQSELGAAERALENARAAVSANEIKVAQAEKGFNDDKASGAEVEEARGALAEASGKIKGLETRVETARRDLTRRQNALPATQNAVREAERMVDSERAKGAAARAAAPVVDTAPPVAELEPEEAPEAGGLSIAEAERMTNQALRESRLARREADRMQTRIDEYNRQVGQTRRAFEGATQSLQNAQQQVMASVPRPRFTSAYAPATGSVVWISRLAREVRRGQSVFGIARGHRLIARFNDGSTAWKKLKVGQTLPSMLDASTPALATSAQVPKPAITNAAASATTQAQISASTPKAATPTIVQTAAPTLALGTPATLTLTRIEAAADGQGAVLEGQVRAESNLPSPDAGMTVVASLPQEGQVKRTLTVPASALVERDGNQWVAVLEAERARPTTAITTATATDAAGEGLSPRIEDYRLQWRRVEVGRSDVFQNQIRGGLRAGERVIIDPALLLVQAPPQSPQLPRIRLWSQSDAA